LLATCGFDEGGEGADGVGNSGTRVNFLFKMVVAISTLAMFLHTEYISYQYQEL
jgi:hypothetical protein